MSEIKDFADKPNILLLTIDTLRGDMLHHPRRLMPTLDAVAAKGISFEQAITGGSWTQAAFPTILTSTYASMYGGCLGPLSPERPSPIEVLAAAGYKTAGFSTNPLVGERYGYGRGFQHFVDLKPGGDANIFLRRIKGGQRLLRNPLTHYVSGWLGRRMIPPQFYVSAGKLNKAVYDWLKKVQSPFFAWVHYMDVHWPYHLDESLNHPKEIAQAWQDTIHLHAANFYGETITAAQKEHYRRLYERAVRYTDKQIRALLTYLKKQGFADNTIILIVSDHGEEFLERRHWGHVEINLYDEILKVPFVICLPGQTQGQVVERQVSTLDIMPTILELSGCEAPEGMLGSSLTPLWHGEPEKYDADVAICERWRDTSHIIAVRTASFKYIWHDQAPDKPELYDLRVDPDETENVIDQYPQVAQQLHGYVDKQLERVAETLPPEDVAMLEMDAEMIERLRGLGYIE